MCESTMFSARDIYYVSRQICSMTQKENESDVVMLSGCSE